MLPEDVSSLLAFYAPDPQRLIDLLRSRLDGSAMRQIAMTDMYEFDEHLAALLKIHATGQVPRPLEWNPKEALELMRWADPEKDNTDPAIAQHLHLLRGFSCAILLSATSGIGGVDDGENSSVIQLVDSAITLADRDVVSAGLSLLAHRIIDDGQTRANDDLPFFSFGLLLLAIHADSTLATPEQLVRLCRFVDEEEERVRHADWATRPSDDPSFLLGLTFYTTSHNRWRDLTRRWLVDQQRPIAEPASSDLRRLGERVLGGV